jgi:DNA-binding NarL/FixJ family response regulator
MISVFIVEDHSIVVEGLLTLLQNEKDITIAGSATTGEKCLQFFKTGTADVVLMDINLPDISGIELCKKIKSAQHSTMVLALSTFNEGGYMRKVMENGASGYLLKNVGKEELLEAINQVAKGGVYFSAEAGKTYRAAVEKQNQVPILTKREKEILKLVVSGKKNQEIGQELFISIDTVDTHRKNLYTKLGVNSVVQLMKYVQDNPTEE